MARSFKFPMLKCTRSFQINFHPQFYPPSTSFNPVNQNWIFSIFQKYIFPDSDNFKFNYAWIGGLHECVHWKYVRSPWVSELPQNENGGGAKIWIFPQLCSADLKATHSENYLGSKYLKITKCNNRSLQLKHFSPFFKHFSVHAELFHSRPEASYSAMNTTCI